MAMLEAAEVGNRARPFDRCIRRRDLDRFSKSVLPISPAPARQSRRWCQSRNRSAPSMPRIRQCQGSIALKLVSGLPTSAGCGGRRFGGILNIELTLVASCVICAPRSPANEGLREPAFPAEHFRRVRIRGPLQMMNHLRCSTLSPQFDSPTPNRSGYKGHMTPGLSTAPCGSVCSSSPPQI